MKFEEFLKSKLFVRIIFGVALFVVAAVIFAAGVWTGLEKARFSGRWEENYYRNFAGPGPGRMGDKMFVGAHGSAGQIIKVDSGSITIKGVDGVEKNILINSKTTIREGANAIVSTDLKVNDNVAVFGTPDDKGEIVATLIRVLPDSMPGMPK